MDKDAYRTEAGPGSLGTTAYVLTGLFFATWLCAVVFLSSKGFILRPSPLPLSWLQLSIVLPMAGFWIAYAISNAFKRYVLSFSLVIANMVQCWRVLGLALLVVWGFGLLPGGFAIPMSVLDASVGLFAVWSTWRFIYRKPHWRRAVIITNAWGFLDFFVTITLVFVGTRLAIDPPVFPGGYADLRELPLSAFPTFAIPAFSMFHFMVFAQLWSTREVKA